MALFDGKWSLFMKVPGICNHAAQKNEQASVGRVTDASLPETVVNTLGLGTFP